MTHFIPCTYTMAVDHWADLMLRHVWKSHGTTSPIVSDQGSVYILQVTKQLNHHLGIWMHLSMVYHSRTERKSEISNKAAEKKLHHLPRDYQDEWKTLVSTAKFAHNSNDHVSIGVFLFKEKLWIQPTFKVQLKYIEEVQFKLTERLIAAQE